MRRTSSQTSLSTDSALNSKWHFADTTRLRVSNGHDSPRAASDADDLLYDDDIFGSAAWRKKRGKKFSPRASPNGSAFAKTGDDSNPPQQSQDTGNETWFNAVGRWVSDAKFRMSLLVSTTWPLRLSARRTSTVPAASAGVRQQGGRATGQGTTTTANNSPMSTSPAVEMSDISNEALVQQVMLRKLWRCDFRFADRFSWKPKKNSVTDRVKRCYLQIAFALCPFRGGVCFVSGIRDV